MNSPVFRVPLYVAVIAMGIVMMARGQMFGIIQVILAGVVLGLWVNKWRRGE